MNDWFRSWHGAPTDNKWLVIGRRAGVAPGIVSAMVWALFDHASQADDRGSIAAFDIETYAAFSGFDEDQITRVLGALTDKAVIVNGRLAAWDKRQPKREDGSAERARGWREQKKLETERTRTHPNANKRPDKRREDTDAEGEEQAEDPREQDPPLRKADQPAPPPVAAKPVGQTADDLGPWLRTLVGTEPVLMDLDLKPIIALLDEGMTRADVEAGIKAAMDERTFRPKAWKQFCGWIRRAAKDRLARAPKRPGGAAAPELTAGRREDGQRAILRRYKDEPNTWPAGLGPRPEEAGCVIPLEILSEFGFAGARPVA